MIRVWNFLEEVCRSSYDPFTNKIIGANFGSVVWHHENRHREQHLQGWWDMLGTLNFITVCIFSGLFTLAVLGVITEGYFLACLSWIPAITIYQILEIEAWVQAIRIKTQKHPIRTRYTKRKVEEPPLQLVLKEGLKNA